MSQIFFLDFETTGLNPFYHEIIEIAINKIGSKDPYHRLVRPTFGVSEPRAGGLNLVPPHITKLTGITSKMVTEEGTDTESAIMGMLDYIQSNVDEGPIYIVSHNGASFDFLFLKRYLREFCHADKDTLSLTSRFKYIDTVLLAKLFMRDDRVNQNRLCQRYNIKNNAEHRALGDVNALEKIYHKLCEGYAEHKHLAKTYYKRHTESIVQDTFMN